MIVIARGLLDEIRRRAEAAYPEECCGLLLGHEQGKDRIVVSAAVASANLAAEPQRHFEVDPALYLRLSRSAATEPSGARLVGLYHSHPEGGAMPSASDAAQAWQEGWIWLIVPLASGHAGVLSAFRLARMGGPFEAVALAPC
ncbi:MAG TPA: M67 family metallopeptidase [Alphaproteobacteria bacterium]|nr:M67 family metallopeptidase [Alphaproteobacteria bacterium]